MGFALANLLISRFVQRCARLVWDGFDRVEPIVSRSALCLEVESDSLLRLTSVQMPGVVTPEFQEWPVRARLPLEPCSWPRSLCLSGVWGWSRASPEAGAPSDMDRPAGPGALRCCLRSTLVLGRCSLGLSLGLLQHLSMSWVAIYAWRRGRPLG